MKLKWAIIDLEVYDVINTNDCKIQYKEHNFLVNNIRKIISDMKLSIYDEGNIRVQ